MQTTEGEKNLNPQGMFKATSLESVATPNPEAAVVHDNDFNACGCTDNILLTPSKANTPLGKTIIAGS